MSQLTSTEYETMYIYIQFIIYKHRPGGHPLLKIQSYSKWKKEIFCFVFLFQKYDKFWSVLLDNFIKHKPPISEEWDAILLLCNIFWENENILSYI